MNIEKLSRSRRAHLAQLLVGVQFLSLFVIAFIVLARVNSQQHSYLTFELGSFAVGLLIIASAAVALRPSLRVSPIPKTDSPLIEVGIYKLVRHPMYLGVILIGFGAAGYADFWLSWLFGAILVINLNIKARFEDALLLEIHPESVHYQAHVSRILPCLGGSCRTNCATR